MAKEAVRGGAPPHKNNLIGTATVGVFKLVPLKMNNTALECSLSSRLFAARPVLTDAELSPHHRLKIPSKSIQHDFEVIAMRDKQLSISNTEQRLPIARESFQEPRGTKQEILPAE